LAAVAAASAAAVLMIGVPAVAGSPFTSLVGAWSGSGTAHLEAGANVLKLNIICANPSTKVELRSTLNYAGGHVTGTWEERNYNQTGTISGTASDEKLGLSITGTGLSGFLSVSIGGASQSVSLSTKGSTLKGVSITFARVS
jgi:hypothetical protein